MKLLKGTLKIGVFSLALWGSISFGAQYQLSGEGLRKISGYRFGACDWWNNIQTNMGMNYACGSYPQSITVPDAYDVARALDAAENRIAALEAKIGTLEKQLEKSE
mgnify:CR=1 FL=1